MRFLFLFASFSLSDTKVIITILSFTIDMIIFTITIIEHRVATANRPGPDHLVFTIRDVFKEKFAHKFGQAII